MRNKKLLFGRWAILAAAAAFVAMGVWRQEQREVLEKAVKLCLECIGIG